MEQAKKEAGRKTTRGQTNERRDKAESPRFDEVVRLQRWMDGGGKCCHFVLVLGRPRLSYGECEPKVSQ
jgi:hypothetical protein